MLTLQPRRARFRGLILQILWRETENGEAREFVNERPNNERF